MTMRINSIPAFGLAENNLYATNDVTRLRAIQWQCVHNPLNLRLTETSSVRNIQANMC